MKRIYRTNIMQRGQAMVEFIVSMTMVMGVLLLAIAMLGKFNDIRNRTLMGSRYLAWERTVWSDSEPAKNLAANPETTEGWSSTYGDSALSVAKSDAELRGEVMQRLITADNSPVSSVDRRQNQLSTSLPAMWQDYGGNSLLTSSADISASTDTSADPTVGLNGISRSQWPMRTATGGQYIAQLSLPNNTLRSGTLSIAVGSDNEVLKRLWPKDGSLPQFSGLVFSDSNVLMTNTWVPDGAASNKALFSKAVPAANVALVPSGEYLGLQKYAPEIATLEFGRIEQDVVPDGRLRK